MTCGSTDESFELLKRKMATNKGLKMICIDVANGYREVFLNFVRRLGEISRKDNHSGNVATREMTEALILWCRYCQGWNRARIGLHDWKVLEWDTRNFLLFRSVLMLLTA